MPEHSITFRRMTQGERPVRPSYAEERLFLDSDGKLKTLSGRTGEVEDVVEGGGSGEPAAPALLSVATNADKLALTGIPAGQDVLITGEGNRLEKYIGGSIDSDDSWLVLRNTVLLESSWWRNLSSGTEGVIRFYGSAPDQYFDLPYDGEVGAAVHAAIWVDPARLTVASLDATGFPTGATGFYSTQSSGGALGYGNPLTFPLSVLTDSATSRPSLGLRGYVSLGTVEILDYIP